jgi:hypothetical protein
LEIVAQQGDVILTNWDDVCDARQLTAVELSAFLGRQFLNPYAFAE